MGFNADKFQQDKLEPRQKEVPVPALSRWFDEGESPVWVVRGLNSNEVQIANEAKQRRDNIANIVKALADNADQVKAVRDAIGLPQGAPGEIVKRLEMLVIGSISPKIDMPTAIKLAEAFPIEFHILTNEITVLTGQGFDLVKPIAASQVTPD